MAVVTILTVAVVVGVRIGSRKQSYAVDVKLSATLRRALGQPG